MRTILLLCLSILFLPLTLAAEGLTIIGGTPDTDYSYKDNVYTVLTGTKLTFSGTTTTDRIVIAEGVTADITLNDLSIDVSAIADAVAMRLEKKVKLTLHITGTESTLKSGNNAAGIGLSDECDLHITAESETPKLTVWGGNNSSNWASSGAAIGGNLSEEGKASIKISNGTISATGGTGGNWGNAGDGIGQSGDRKLQMAIILDGGKITAKGGDEPWNGTAGYGINGNMTVNSGIFTNCTLNGDITITSGSYTNCTLKGNIVINDGTFTNCPISGTKAIINKGTINNTDGSRISSKEIIINGGDITVTLPKSNADNAIGDQDCNITINGGTVIATANCIDSQNDPSGAGIAGTITINGGHITATASGRNGAGIGGYGSYRGGTQNKNDTKSNKPITITGGTVIASGGSVGIGSGPGVPAQLITITGGTITAKGTHWTNSPVGIGSGRENGSSDGIIITGGSIKSTFKDALTDQSKATVYLAITPEIANATDVSVDDIPYYISGNHPQEKEKTADNKLYLYMTGAVHTVAVRTSENKVVTYTATYVSGGVNNNGNNNGYFSFDTGTEANPDKESEIAFEAENITTAYNKEGNALEVKLTITITEQTITTRSAAMNSVQLALSDRTTTYYSDRQTVTDSGEYRFTFDTKGLDAGSYTLTANYGGSTTNKVATEQTTRLTIEQAEGSKASDYKEPTDLKATYGQTLADVTLPAGWAWNAPETSVGNVSSSPATFTATFTPTDTKNYKTVSKDLSVTVNKAKASDPGTPAVLSSSPVTYGTKLSEITITDGWQWADGAIVPDANNYHNYPYPGWPECCYMAYYPVKDDANYDWSSISGYNSSNHHVERYITVKVDRADLTANNFTFAAPTNLVYDGQAKAATVTAKDGLTGIGAIAIKYYKDGATEVSEPTEVGTYTVKIDVAEGDNCKSTSDLTTPEWTFTILPKSDPPVNPPVDPDDPDNPAPVHYTVTLPAIEGATTDPAAGSYEVESWGSFSFLLTLDEGYRTDSHPVVTARGETLTPNASTGKYTIQHVRSDITVEITGIVKDVATGNETLSDGFHITTSGRLLLVTVPRAIRLYLTDTSGRLILTRQLPAGDTRIDNLAAGVYLLTLEGEKTKKIIIR
ncbi:hypothetical protein [Parabacteroides gordonii]|uniref:hypothetical protein n=1 Tax=Parabacteroides gordonii TaxID=574930 RepID=UPI0026F23912|nr:hypothetical protein [Parabacteroides gordonii]